MTWIDKTAVSCSVEYSPETASNQDVLASLTGCNKAVTVTNNEGSTNYTFTGNGSFAFTYKDGYGNT